MNSDNKDAGSTMLETSLAPLLVHRVHTATTAATTTTNRPSHITHINLPNYDSTNGNESIISAPRDNNNNNSVTNLATQSSFLSIPDMTRCRTWTTDSNNTSLGSYCTFLYDSRSYPASPELLASPTSPPVVASRQSKWRQQVNFLQNAALPVLQANHSGSDIAPTIDEQSPSHSNTNSSNSNPFVSQQLPDHLVVVVKHMVEELERQRDMAVYEAEDAKEVLSHIMEAIQILTKQIKHSHFAILTSGSAIPSAKGSSELKETLDRIGEDISNNNKKGGVQKVDSATAPAVLTRKTPTLSLKSRLLTNSSSATSFPVIAPSVKEKNRVRSWSENDIIGLLPPVLYDLNHCPHDIDTHDDIETYCGTTTNDGSLSSLSSPSTVIASYLSTEQQRFSNLSLNLSGTIGADLRSLGHACRMVDENARLLAEESFSSLVDLRLMCHQMQEGNNRADKAEKVAKKLYKENITLKLELERLKKEKRLLVKEVKTLVSSQKRIQTNEALQKKKNRDVEEQQIRGALEVHEHFLSCTSPCRQKTFSADFCDDGLLLSRAIEDSNSGRDDERFVQVVSSTSKTTTVTQQHPIMGCVAPTLSFDAEPSTLRSGDGRIVEAWNESGVVGAQLSPTIPASAIYERVNNCTNPNDYVCANVTADPMECTSKIQVKDSTEKSNVVDLAFKGPKDVKETTKPMTVIISPSSTIEDKDSTEKSNVVDLAFKGPKVVKETTKPMTVIISPSLPRKSVGIGFGGALGYGKFI